MSDLLRNSQGGCRRLQLHCAGRQRATLLIKDFGLRSAWRALRAAVRDRRHGSFRLNFLHGFFGHSNRHGVAASEGAAGAASTGASGAFSAGSPNCWDSAAHSSDKSTSCTTDFTEGRGLTFLHWRRLGRSLLRRVPRVAPRSSARQTPAARLGKAAAEQLLPRGKYPPPAGNGV